MSIEPWIQIITISLSLMTMMCFVWIPYLRDRRYRKAEKRMIQELYLEASIILHVLVGREVDVITGEPVEQHE